MGEKEQGRIMRDKEQEPIMREIKQGGLMVKRVIKEG